MLYLLIIIGGGILIALTNFALVGFALDALPSILLGVAVGIAAIIAVDGLIALLIRRLLPTRWFSAECRVFAVSRGERNFYQRLHIKAWKDRVPELGMFTGFSKGELKSPNDPAYLARFLMESNYGVVIHLFNALLGFVILWIPLCAAPTVWVPIFAVNFVLSLLPVAVLRYTAHTLQGLYRRTVARHGADGQKVL